MLAIPHAFALQERRTRAFMVRRFAGAFYLLPLARMDAIKKDSLFRTVYAKGQPPRQRFPRVEPFHLGWSFDVAVIVALLIAMVGFITA